MTLVKSRFRFCWVAKNPKWLSSITHITRWRWVGRWSPSMTAAFICYFLQPENCMSSYDPHGFLVIYSSADRSSFLVAERVLQTLWTSENIAQKAVILVGNKADLARSRLVSSEGELMAIWTFRGALSSNLSTLFYILPTWNTSFRNDVVIISKQIIKFHSAEQLQHQKP